MSSVLEILQRKLAYLQAQEAIASNPSQKFQLQVEIEECQQKMRELEREDETPKIPKKEQASQDIGESSKHKQFREKVQEYLEDHQLTDAERTFLEQRRKRLGLTKEEAEKIIAEEENPIVQARNFYKELLIELIQKGCYPFDAAISKDLEKIKEEDKLQEWEIKGIEQPILRTAEAEYKLREIKKKSKPFSFEIVKVDREGKIIKRETRSARYFSEALGNDINIEMVYIPEGEFWMGTEDEEIERLVRKYEVEYFRWEKPRYKVTVPSFYMGKYPITQAQWKVIASLPKIDRDLKPDPSNFKGENRPVECVNWHDVVEYCKRLSKRTGKEYRLPSEAEWEYACRARTNTPFHFGETITAEIANYNGNYTYAEESQGEYSKGTTPVGQFPPNAFGLYDMHGNVSEWCLDDWHDNYEGAPNDGSAWINHGNHSQKCLRGGSWNPYPWSCRSAYRDGYDPDVDYFFGLRVVCVGAGL